MSSLSGYNFFSLTPLSANFDNSDLSFNQTLLPYEQNLNLNYIQCLSGILDAKISNHSNLFLTRKLKDTDIFSINNISDNYNFITTTISTSGSYGRLFLNFNPSNNTYNFVQSSIVADTRNLIFEIELIDSTFCRVKHINNGTKLYLNYVTGTFSFSAGVDFVDYTIIKNGVLPPANADLFKYNLDKTGKINLKFPDTTYKIVVFDPNTTNFKLSTFKELNPSFYSNTDIFLITYPTNAVNYKLNTSWVNYLPENINSGYIDNNSSAFDIINNNIVHYEYNALDNNLNVIKLKNNISEKNYTKRASNMFLSGGSTGKINTPVPLFRDYTSIHTGTIGEKSYENLTLTYVNYDKDFIVNSGEITEIKTAATLYPYTQINVNDTTFVKDGAFGAPVPYISDKIYFKNAIKGNEQNSTYLVTWLSANNIGDYGVWMDRYYYPDIISRQNALTLTNTNISFTDPVQAAFGVTQTTSNAYIQANPVFDKISDLVFLPNQTYYYSRVSKDEIVKFVQNYPNLVYNNFTSYYNINDFNIPYAESSISFDGGKYVIFDTTEINRTGSFVISFDLINNWYANQFNSLFGVLVDRGFSITNDERITPFSYVFGNSTLNVYNSNSSLLYTLCFNDKIKDVIVGDQLQDYYVTWGNQIARVNSSGQIKNVSLIPQLSSYINYDIKDSTSLAFLLSADGKSIELNLNSFTVSSFTAPSFTSTDLNRRGIKYINGNYYGFGGEKVRLFDDTYVFYLSNNRSIYRENILTLSADPGVPFCTTNSTIYDFNVDNKGNLFVLHGSNNLTVLDKTRKVISNQTLSNITSAFLVDFVSEYSLSSYNFYPLILGLNSSSNNITLNKLDSSYTVVNTLTTNLTGGFVNTATIPLSTPGRLKNITNYNYFKTNLSYKSLNFNLTLKNYYDDTDVYRTKFSIPITTLQTGIQNFIIRFSEKKGVYQLYNNGILLSSFNFDSNKYKLAPLIKTHFKLGATGFHNNLTLANFLRQPGYYFTKNVIVENFKIYNGGLEDYQILPLALENQLVDNLNLSLPGGQTNSVEEISKFFKFTQPINKANDINIIVKNVGESNPALQATIANSILLNANNNLPGDVNINSITFTNYK